MSAILSADDLNDFITPGVACIKPPPQPIVSQQHNSTTKKSNDGIEVEINSLEVSKDVNNLSPAQISLADCLACSGCITSAEEILVAQHSHQELLKALDEHNKVFVASVSHQSRASLATAYNLRVEDIDRLLINLFVNQMGFKSVVGTSLGRKLSLINESYNIISNRSNHGPILSSVCPGWVLYAEKTHPYILPRLSNVKSPQQITGCLLKNIISKQLNVAKSQIFHLSIMPCFDKKLESARPESDGSEEKDVDCVLTAKELVTLLEQQDEFQLIPKNYQPQIQSPIVELYKQVAPKNWPLVEYCWSNDDGSTSGGYSFNYLQMLKQHLLLIDINYDPSKFEIQTVYGKNSDVYELRLLYEGSKVGSAAVVNGFRNIQNLVRKFKPGNKPKINPLVARRKARKSQDVIEDVAEPSKCDFVEIMACPNGCINGGGQITHPQDIDEKTWLLNVVANYQSIEVLDMVPQLIKDIMSWSKQFGNDYKVSETRLFRTWFKEVEKPSDPAQILLGAKW